MNVIITYLPLLFKGASITLAAWLIAGCGGLLLGALCGILSSRAYAHYRFFFVIRLYAFIAKGVPAYVQILIAYFAIPSLLNIHLSGFFAAIIALIFCSGGYVAEIIRSSINGISRGQWEACRVLGYSKRQALRRVILPQVLPVIIPMLLGECEQLLKSTSLLAAIGVTELTRAGMNIISRELNPLPVYFLVASIYLMFAAGLNLVIIMMQKKGVLCAKD